MRPTWGPPGSCRPQVVPILATWTLLLGLVYPAVSIARGTSYSRVSVTRNKVTPFILTSLGNRDPTSPVIFTQNLLSHQKGYWSSVPKIQIQFHGHATRGSIVMKICTDLKKKMRKKHDKNLKLGRLKFLIFLNWYHLCFCENTC